MFIANATAAVLADVTKTDGGVEADLLEILLRLGTRWVLWLLLALSVLALTVALERLVFFTQERRPRLAITQALAAVRSGDLARALAALRGERSMAAAVIRTCVEHAPDGPAAVEEHMLSAIESQRLRYERGLAFLGTLGNNAPFIGLFGTVLGILRAFHDLSGNLSGGASAVMDGIAESLVATCVGLVVALPAVAAYNACARHVEAASSSAESLGRTVLGYLKRAPDADGAAATRATDATAPGAERA